MSDQDFLYADEATAREPEGFTETRLRIEGANRELVDEAMRPVREGMKKLTMNGGKGQEGVELIGDAVMTVKESVAVRIAEDVIADATRRHGKDLKELTLLQLNEGLAERVKGRATSVGQVMAELGRLQNRAIYGDRVRRR